jgi:hypothetical protein
LLRSHQKINKIKKKNKKKRFFKIAGTQPSVKKIKKKKKSPSG